MLVSSALGYNVNPHYPSQSGGQYVTSLSPTLTAVSTAGGPIALDQYQTSLTDSGVVSPTGMLINPVSSEITPGVSVSLDSMVTNPMALQAVTSTAAGMPLSVMATEIGISQLASDYGGLSTSPVSSNGSKLNGASNMNGCQSPALHPSNIHSTAEYLQQLLKDRARLAAFPGTFLHAERLLDLGK